MHGLTEEQWDEFQKLVRAAARRVAAQWPVTVERDDLEQGIAVRLLESPGAVERLFEEQEQQVRQSFLIKVGHQIASQEQADYERFSGQHMYDSGQVRGLLERQVWLVEEKTSSEKLDLEQGLALLAEKNSGHYAAIINRFVHEIIPDSADSTGRSRIQRAVESLADTMNRIHERKRREYTEGPGTRTILSNSQARGIQNNLYEVPK